MRRFMCFFGFHQWEYQQKNKVARQGWTWVDPDGIQKQKHCAREGCFRSAWVNTG